MSTKPTETLAKKSKIPSLLLILLGFAIMAGTALIINSEEVTIQNNVNQEEITKLSAVGLIEGKHFEVLDNKINTDSDILEFFWYGCPHCWNAEEPLNKLKKRNPTLTFEKQHAQLSQGWIMDAVMYYSLNEDNKQKTSISEDYFKSRHDGSVKTKEDWPAFLAKHGLDENFVNKQLKNPIVISALDDSQKMGKKAKLRSVPAFIVNGQYRLKSGAFKDWNDMMDNMEIMVTALDHK